MLLEKGAQGHRLPLQDPLRHIVQRLKCGISASYVKKSDRGAFHRLPLANVMQNVPGATRDRTEQTHCRRRRRRRLAASAKNLTVVSALARGAFKSNRGCRQETTASPVIWIHAPANPPDTGSSAPFIGYRGQSDARIAKQSSD
jgi:hypothetical protein